MAAGADPEAPLPDLSVYLIVSWPVLPFGQC